MWDVLAAVLVGAIVGGTANALIFYGAVRSQLRALAQDVTEAKSMARDAHKRIDHLLLNR